MLLPLHCDCDAEMASKGKKRFSWHHGEGLLWIYGGYSSAAYCSATGMKSILESSSLASGVIVSKCTATQLPMTVGGVEKATLQNQVFEQIRTMIIDGRLRAGSPLPATRELSAQMGISRNTAVLSYERLISEGYIYTRPNVGTFVATEIPEKTFLTSGPDRQVAANGHDVLEGSSRGTKLSAISRVHSLRNPHRKRLKVDFWVGRPDPASFPVKAWSKHVWNRLQRSGTSLTEYGDPAGLIDLREAICDHLGPARGIIADPDQVVIVSGCQEGFNLIGRMLIESGDSIVVENPCYQGAAYVLEGLGGVLHPVPVDGDGMDVSQLPEVSGAVVYVTPSHQYPMGVTMTLPRRVALLGWAMRNDAYIIEDDYDSDFRFTGSPITALKGLDRGNRVIYMGTFSKCMGPGLRLGFLVLPPHLAEAARRLKTLMNNGNSWLEQAAMADFMLDGGYRRHLRRVRQTYMERRDALLRSLETHFGKCDVSGEDAGMHLIWSIPDGMPDAVSIERKALENEIGVYTFSTGAALHFGSGAADRRHLVLGYAALTPREIEAGIAGLKRSVLSGNPAVAVARSLKANGDCS